ncbi:MAG: hypothetical protein R6X02_20680 [Enhygromyxa sp.]
MKLRYIEARVAERARLLVRGSFKGLEQLAALELPAAAPQIRPDDDAHLGRLGSGVGVKQQALRVTSLFVLKLPGLRVAPERARERPLAETVTGLGEEFGGFFVVTRFSGDFRSARSEKNQQD